MPPVRWLKRRRKYSETSQLLHSALYICIRKKEQPLARPSWCTRYGLVRENPNKTIFGWVGGRTPVFKKKTLVSIRLQVRIFTPKKLRCQPATPDWLMGVLKFDLFSRRVVGAIPLPEGTMCGEPVPIPNRAPAERESLWSVCQWLSGAFRGRGNLSPESAGRKNKEPGNGVFGIARTEISVECAH